MALVVGANPLAAQESREVRYGDEHIGVELIADGPPIAGEVWTLALQFTPSSDEWHGYWSNPGDAGQGMTLDLNLIEGWEMGEPLYPVPQRYTISGLMNHIYKGPYTVLVPIKVPMSAAVVNPAPVTGFVEYLACTDKICVPQDAVLEQRAGGDFAQWRADIAPKLDARGSFEIATGRLRIAIPLPEAVNLSQPHVFVSNTRLVDYAAVQTFMREGDMLVAEIPLDEYGTGEAQVLSGILAFAGGDDGRGVRFEAGPGDVPELAIKIAGPVGVDTPPLWILLLGALAGGLILNIMPCVFPILSLKAISLARAGESQAQARREGLAYTAGVVLACLALGAFMLLLRSAGENVGWAFQLQEPIVVVLLLVLATVITFNLAGLFELPSLALTRRGEPASAFATGLLAAFVATPCTGPFMALALGAALLLPPLQALLLFAMLGLGLALPFLLIGFVPALRAMLPRPGAWMEGFRKLMAVPMGLTALALVWLVTRLGGEGFAMFALVMTGGIVLALAVVGRLQRAGKMAWPAFGLIAAPFVIFGAFALPASYTIREAAQSQSILSPQKFSEEALVQARATGQPVFVWFTADWCVTCKVNEGVAINRESTHDAFEAAGVIAMEGDWTRRDSAIASFLNAQGAAGIPLYLWYPAGASEPEQLPQILTPAMLEERARSASPSVRR